MRMLNLGCGGCFHRDWINLDLNPQDPAVLRHDLAEPLPFDDASCDAVYHSHVLEHIPRSDAPAFIAECFRVLRPGGLIRVVVPDLERIVLDYRQALRDLDADPDDHLAGLRHEWSLIQLLDQCVRSRSGGDYNVFLKQAPGELIGYLEQRTGTDLIRTQSGKRTDLNPAEGNPFPPITSLLKSPRVFRNHVREWLLSRLLGKEMAALKLGRFRRSGEVHQWMYDRHNLERLLGSAGFIRCKVQRADESQLVDWPAFELDTGADGSVRKPDSLFMEAVRP